LSLKNTLKTTAVLKISKRKKRREKYTEVPFIEIKINH